MWHSLGTLLIATVFIAGCPAGGAGGNQNGNDNTNGNANSNSNNNANSNNNSNDNTGQDIEPGVDLLIPNEGHAHVPVGQQVEYVANPPASGAHWSSSGTAPVPAGFYETTLEEEQWVHNLEHGYVVILYDCRGPCSKAVIDQLDGFFAAAPPSQHFGNVKLVISPYDGLPFAFVAIAWDHQLHLESFDADALLDFYETYVDQGPELVP